MSTLKPKQGYKLVPTLFGKFQEIPEDWEMDEIQNHAKITTGDKNTQDKVKGGKYPFFVRSKKVERINSFSYDGEAVLTAGDGDIGKIFHYVDGKFDFHQRVYKISEFDKLLDGHFFYLYFSNYFLNRAISMSAKNTVGSIRMDMITKMLIPLPSIKEQKKIASILSILVNLIEKYDSIIDSTKKLKTGLMQTLLTKGIGHKKFKKVKWYFGKEIEIPIEWELKQVKDITNINSEQIKDNYPHEEIEYVDISSINNFQITHLEKYKTSERPSRAQRLVKESDIIISTVRPYLESFSLVSLNLPNLICSTGFSVLHSKHESDTNFLFNYFLSSFFKISYVKHMEGMAYPAITSSVIAQSLIPTPNDENERKQIGEILLKVNSKISNLELNKSSLNKIKKGLMQKLLTGQIRVAA